MSINAAVFGSTGLVGSKVLATLLGGACYSTVHTISRREPKCSGAALRATVEADTSAWDQKLHTLSPPATTVYSAIGTTRVAAGGIANQWKIDHDLNVQIAKAAKTAGARVFVFVSSAGVRGPVAGWLPYSRMKVGVEDTIRALDFEQAVVVKPGLIMGEREAPHPGDMFETVVRGLSRCFGQGFQDRVGQEAEVIARAVVAAARMAEEGKAPDKYWELQPADVLRLGRDGVAGVSG